MDATASAARKTLPKRCWEETLEAYRARLKACAAQINSACDVDGLCRVLPSRVMELDRRQGDRPAKKCGSLKNSACPI